MTYSFKPKPFEQALKFWDSKVILKPGQFAKLSAEAQVRAFAVGGMAKSQELKTIFQGLRKQMESGVSFADFKKEISTVIETRGWTGPKAWRVENIFRTNLQTAYQVGRYQQMADNAGNRPWWLYDAVMDGSTRATHAAQHGKVYRHDHPFWDTWFPPNGFRCRCSVRTLSERQLEDRGLTPETKDPTGKLVEPIDPVTGRKLPARLMMPDRGFELNPGKTVWGGVTDGARQTGGLYDPLPNLRGPAHYRRPGLVNVNPSQIADLDEGRLLDKGLSVAAYAAEFAKLYGEELAVVDAAGDPVLLSLRTFQIRDDQGKVIGYKFNKPGHGEMIPVLKDILEQPYEVWLTPQANESGQVRLTKRYIGLWKTADKKRIGGLMACEVIDGVLQGVTAFVPLKRGETDLKYLEKQRQGLLLYSKGR